MSSLSRLIHFAPFFALSIISYCYLISMMDSMLWFLPIKGTHSFYGRLNLLVLTGWFLLILYNFFRAALVGPGYVPLRWHPKYSRHEKYLRFCEICQGYKPPRSHHCRICQRCVLKMDHHCPWINNCCGHRNHTNFVLFLVFAELGCYHGFQVFAGTIWSQTFWLEDYLRITDAPVEFSENALVVTVIAAGFTLGTFIALAILLYFQLVAILNNATTIEQGVITKALDRKARGLNNFIYPYDYGRMENFSQIINWKCTPVGDGYYWPVVKGCTQVSLSTERLLQNLEKQELLVCCEVVRSYSGNPVTLFSYGIRTCVHLPCIIEPRMAIKPGEKIMVSRITKYWFYGKKILSQSEVRAGKRERGWFPSQCVVGCDTKVNEDCEGGNLANYRISKENLSKQKAS